MGSMRWRTEVIGLSGFISTRDYHENLPPRCLLSASKRSLPIMWTFPKRLAGWRLIALIWITPRGPFNLWSAAGEDLRALLPTRQIAGDPKRTRLPPGAWTQ